MIGYPSAHDLTQGTIFTCAASEDYPNSEVRGLVITARCDVAHGKAPIISYVPLIGFRDWLFQDGLRILASRILASCRGTMKAAIREAGLADSILDTLSPDAIREHLAGLTEKAEKAAAKRYAEAETLKASAEIALAASVGAKVAIDFFDSQPKDYHKLVQELLSNNIADHHYVEQTEPNEKCDGYVALLREIRYLPVALANELKGGIDLEAFSALCRDNPRYADKLIISNGDHFALPVGLMQSPFIELFIQRFTQLYARIGVTDYSQDLMRSLRAIVPFNLGATQ